MNMHRYEKIWLIFGTATLLLFLIIVGFSAFYMGNQPPSHTETVDPEEVREIEPFNEPGLKKIGDNEYEFVIVASAFHYDIGADDGVVEIPKDATVHFVITTTDVIHGFEIVGTNVNMMVEPGYISRYTNTFKNSGTYTVLCNEYCGVGHHLMSATIEVIE